MATQIPINPPDYRAVMTENAVHNGRNQWLAAALCSLWLLIVSVPAADAAPLTEIESRPPNILLILADDLGYSDVGAFGSEISTPNIDRLAREGVRLANFHAHIACSPSRAMLLTGVESHLAGFGTMAGDETPEQRGQPGYETRLNFRVLTVADLLRATGYRTYVTGKWDMGVADEFTPDKRGFDRSFVLLNGSADHFEAAAAMEGVMPAYREDGRPVELPRDFYSSDAFTQRMIEFIGERGRDAAPFFALVAYTAPHYPLQAPPAYLDRQVGRYDAGYTAIREARIRRQRALGILPATVTPAPQHGYFPSWEALGSDLRALEARRMEIHAAMIESMDANIGRLLRHLEARGDLDETLVLFLSDNGAEGGNPLEWGWARWAEATKDLSFGRMGHPRSYVWLGPGWAHVSATPWKLFKGYATQGGLVVPAIVRYPGSAGPGTVSHAFATVLDVLPTFLDLARAQHPGTPFEGRELHVPKAGRSLLPLLRGDVAAVHPPDAVTGWELWNRRALRKGNWKIVWSNAPWGRGLRAWSLYDLASDPTELHDLADTRPDKLVELLAAWRQYVAANGVIEVDDFVIGGGANSFHHYEWRPPQPTQH
jgi:arylsulfatase A-like enzyme